MTHLILEFCTGFEGLADFRYTAILLQFKHRSQQCCLYSNFKSPMSVTSSNFPGMFHST